MKRPILNADYIAGVLLGFMLVLFLIAIFGCSSTPCIPKVEIQEKLVPAPCVVQIGVLGPPSLPPYPPFDPINAKEWALQVEQIAKQREALLKDYSDRLEQQVAGHNRLEPKCAQ